MRSVCSNEHRRFRLIQNSIERSSSMRFCAYSVDATIRSTTVGNFLDSVVNTAVSLFKIDRFSSPVFSGHFESLWNAVNCDHPPGSEHPGALNAELSHRAATPNGYSISRFNLGVFSGHVTSWK